MINNRYPLNALLTERTEYFFVYILYCTKTNTKKLFTSGYFEHRFTGYFILGHKTRYNTIFSRKNIGSG